MNDPIHDLERKLTTAARRSLQTNDRRRRRRPGVSSRGLLVCVAALVVAGSATAAVVQLSARPSKPLTGPIDTAAPSARAYAVALLPDLRAGQAGWCGVLRLSTSGQPTAAGGSCSSARAAGGTQIVAAGVVGNRESIGYAVVTADVRAVRFDTTIVATRPDPSLPNGWRYAVIVARTPPAARPDAESPPLPADAGSGAQTPSPSSLLPTLAPASLDADGHELPATTPADDHSRGARSRVVTAARPADRCAIGRARGFRVGYARVALGMPTIPPHTAGRAFASCANTVFHVPGTRGSLTAAILRDAHRPNKRAADLPRAPNLTRRRVGPAWLVISGGSAVQRARLLDRLRPRL